MVKLPSNYCFEYGEFCARLVCETDAPFIIQLRTDVERGRFLHETDNDINRQVEWIKKYKAREADGLEYYFIFLNNEEPYGLQRIYNIDWGQKSFTIGSWICSKQASVEMVARSQQIPLIIAFDILGLIHYTFDVKKENIYLLRYLRKLHYLKEYGEDEASVYFYSSKEMNSHYHSSVT